VCRVKVNIRFAGARCAAGGTINGAVAGVGQAKTYSPRLIDAPESDIFDVLAYVRFTLDPLSGAKQ
jgi:hypothetical protein